MNNNYRNACKEVIELIDNILLLNQRKKELLNNDCDNV